MELMTNLKQYLRSMRFRLFKRNAKKHFPNAEHTIEFAFRSGGVDYYQFADVFSLPYERGLMAVAVYNELDMRCSRDYLLLHTEAMTELLNSKEINIYRINELNEQMKQRLNLVTDVELLYKLASVVFFDKNENPARYEGEYAEKKIERWRKDKSLTDFFLQKPLRELIPFLENVNLDLDMYSVVNKELNEIHLERIRMLKFNA